MKTFEEKIAKLEEINNKMKDSSLSLEEAMKCFSEGTKLAKTLEQELSKMERKVEILLNNPETPDDAQEIGLFPELEDEK